MAVTVGAVYVDVLPSARGFIAEFLAEVLPEADRAGRELGERIGKEAGKAAAGAIGEGIEDGVRRSRPEAAAARKGRDSGSEFAKAFRAMVQAALSKLPDIEVNADTSRAHARLQEVRENMAALRDLDIGVDLSIADALEGIRRLQAELAAIQNDVTIDVEAHVQAAQAIKDLEALKAFIENADTDIEIDVNVRQPNLGAFATKLKADIARIAATLPEIPINADTSTTLAELEVLRSRLATLSANIDIDTDIAATLAELTVLQTAIDALDRDDITIDVRADIASVLAQLAAVRAAAAAVDDGMERGFGANSFGRMSRIRLILGLILALLPVVAGAVVALSAAFALVVTPVAAVAAGVDGIKKAFAELEPAIMRIREATSAAFEQGLAPAVDNVARLLPIVEEGLTRTAIIMSDVAEQISAVATSGENLGIISENFDLINAIIATMAPSLGLLTDNMVKLTNVGLKGMVGWGEELRQIGVAWQGVIDRLAASGTGEAAVRAFFQILSELLNLIAPLTEFGSVLLATFGPALAAAISVVAQAFSSAAGFIEGLPGPLQTVAAAATAVGLVMLVLGTRITAAAVALRSTLSGAVAAASASFTAMRLAIINATAGIAGLGAAGRIAAPGLAAAGVAARGLLLALGGPVGILITGIVILLSALGGMQADAAAAADQHKAAIQELSSALKESGGAINSNILELTRQKLEANGAAEAADALGLSIIGVSQAVANGGPQYDALREKLTQLATVKKSTAIAGTQLSETERLQVDSANALLAAIGPLREGFVSAAEQNKLLGDALFVTGNSMVGGVDGAKALEEAFATLANEMSTVKEKGDALYDLMIRLSGQTIPLSIAQGELGEAVRDLGEKFVKLNEANGGVKGSMESTRGTFEVASQAGLEFAKSMDELLHSTTNAAASAFEAAGGADNLAAATKAAGDEATFARQKFIEQAVAQGYSATRAGELADAYGLIPELIVTLLKAEGIPQVQQDLLQVNQLLQGVPKNTTVNVGVLSADAIAALKALGLQVTTLPEGKIGVTIQDEAGRKKLAEFIQKIEHPVTTTGTPTPQVPVGINPTSALEQSKILNEGLSNPANPPAVPTGLNTSAVPGQVTDVQGQVTGTQANVPTSLDTSKVAPQLDEIKNTALTTVATMPLNPIKGSGWDADLAAIKASVLLTVAEMPINAIKGSGWDLGIQTIRQEVGLTAAIMPIDCAKSISFEAQLEAIRQSVTLIPAQLPIDAVKSINFDAQIQAIKDQLRNAIGGAAEQGLGDGGSGGGGGVAILPIDAAKSINFDTQLAAIKASVSTPVAGGVVGAGAAVIPIDCAKSISFDAALLAIRQSIGLLPAVIPINADVAPARLTVDQLVAAIQLLVVPIRIAADFTIAVEQITAFINEVMQVVVPIGIAADLSLAVQAVNDFATAVSQMVIPITIVAQISFGGLGGIAGADGGVVTGGGNNFDAASETSRSFAPGLGSPAPPPSSGTGQGLFNPDAQLDTSNIDDLRPNTRFAIGAYIKAMASGGMLGGLTPMKGGVAQVVPPNTWRVIGDRVTDDEAFIPINNAARSHKILAVTANRMGYGLSAQETGSFMSTQQTGSFSNTGTWESAPSGREAPLVGSLTLQASPKASASDLADEVMFRLRTERFGGLYGGRR